jgi:MinD superfamily P-loop ATPase
VQAISEKDKEIGLVECGVSGNIGFVHGRLNVGEAMSPPLIRAVLDRAPHNGICIIDAPPGTSCPVIAALRNVDFVVLVTEPTPFGLNDLGLALDMVSELQLPHGIIINRAESGNLDAQEFCEKRQVMVLAEIPDDRRIAEAYSRGEIVLNVVPEVHAAMQTLWSAIRKQVHS